jgi:ribokinase
VKPVVHACVVGATNVDLVLRTASLPLPGETLLGRSVERLGGGKGANQAVGLARLGARVSLVSAVGDDADGRWSLAELEAENVDTTGVLVVPGSTGLAVVTVDDKGENSIVVIPGANTHVQVPDPLPAADVALLSLEVPLVAVLAAARRARAQGSVVVLNAAPAQHLSRELLEQLDVLVVNEIEWQAVGSAAPCDVVLTRGALGAEVHQGGEVTVVPAPQVDCVDTTGAGDCFSATLAFHLGAGRSLRDAAAAACVAAAESVTQVGARPRPARMGA